MGPTYTRRYDVDWLRVGATLLLFIFHTGMVFNPAPFYHIRNDELSFGWLVVCGFISLWHMPLFFLLAGWSLCASLRARGGFGVLKERSLRLLVPLAFGCISFMPVIKYLELSSGLDLRHTGLHVTPALQDGFRVVIPEGLSTAAPFHQSFAEFLPTFFTLDRFTWAHLWFVAYLFTFTILYLPAFSYLLRRTREIRRVPVLVVYAPVVPLIAIQVLLRPHWPGIQNLYDDWANVAYYTTYLFAGFLLARHPAVEQAAHREWRRAFSLGLATCGVLLAGVLRLYESPSVLLAGSAVAGWCFVVAALGLARRFLGFGNAVLHYFGEAAFPVYILHQAAIVVPGYFLIRLPLGIAPKFLLVLTVAVLVTFAVYHFVVRSFAPARLLFGMRPTARPRPVLAARSAAAAFLVFTLAGADAAGAPEGLWYAEGGAAAVRVESCGNALCGRVEWLRSPYDENGCALRDARNADTGLRGRAIEGLEILRGLEPSPLEQNVWGNGTIYDPASGRTYRCRLTVDGDRLHLRGYVGVPVLGRSTTWIRVGAESRICRERASNGP
jgi:glucans biosynthesis protein C